jgi:hypothetical protein
MSRLRLLNVGIVDTGSRLWPAAAAAERQVDQAEQRLRDLRTALCELRANAEADFIRLRSAIHPDR